MNPHLAIDTPVIASDADAPERVSLSFGLLEISGPHMAKRNIKLTNLSGQPWAGSIVVSNTLANAGVTLTPAKPTVSVPAKGSATVELTLTIDPARVQLLFDPTTPPEVKGGPRQSRMRRPARFGFTVSHARSICRITCCCVRWAITVWKPVGFGVRQPEGVAPVMLP
ncbi:MAG: hypothetical protein CM1200mP29_15590 [Verrucomicrobiota bacterium]|nr:MAG: hypothetical protein CM1200mP29_15590 [Verrucomicrobiota bacterium]